MSEQSNSGPPGDASEAEQAAWFDEHRDAVGEIFTEHVQSFSVRREVLISVRFSADEIDTVRERAERAGMSPSAYIREAATHATDVVNREAIRKALAATERDLEELRRAVS